MPAAFLCHVSGSFDLNDAFIKKKLTFIGKID